MNQRRQLNKTNRLQRQWEKLKKLSPRYIIDRNTWNRLGRWLVWNLSPKRRRIKNLARQLTPLPRQVHDDIKELRDEVFVQTCLKLKHTDVQHHLLKLLNGATNPTGFDQIFLCSIYPPILGRGLGIELYQSAESASSVTPDDHRLNIEIGYLGHNEDLFFWAFEINGAAQASMDKTLTPQQRTRGDKRYLVYRIGVAGLVEDYQQFDALQWRINSQIYLNKILADLKRRNYAVTIASKPDFAQERWSLLRRLSIDRLKKRRSPS